jgi:hypothetical protein
VHAKVEAHALAEANRKAIASIEDLDDRLAAEQEARAEQVTPRSRLI